MTIKNHREGGILVIQIDNPPVNALSAEVRRHLREAFADPEADAFVLIGAGKTFIGGADIREFDQIPVEPHLPDLLLEMENLGKPVVAAINGAALGGGLETAMAWISILARASTSATTCTAAMAGKCRPITSL